MDKCINIGLGARSYSIRIGTGLLDDSQLIDCVVRPLAPSKIVVISNETVNPLFADKLNFFSDSFPLLRFNIGDGERYKSLSSLESIYEFLLQNTCNRDILICALGGGVVGDLAGFAAATYQRGVNYIQIPTTLLAQVDSSVGGKTAVNHHLGKNMIGAFHQPKAVIIDTNTLATLPKREFSAGLAEIIKYALICDRDFFFWLENNIDLLIERDGKTLDYAIATSCRHKATIVEADEQEQGNRALLNLGHSFGHAIEKYNNYEGWLHGEAVAVGMVCAAKVSIEAGFMAADRLAPISQLLERASLPIDPPQKLDPATMVSLMQLDKKNRNNKLRLILLRDLGDSFTTDQIQADVLPDMLASQS